MSENGRGFWLLFTGTGRCGTGYMANVMSSLGIKCSHEGLFRRDPPEETARRIAERNANAWWGWEAESSWLAAPYLDHPGLEDVTIVHLTRHPKKVIDSQVRIRAFKEGYNRDWQAWQRMWVPELAGLPELEAAATFYVRWNRMIEPYADVRWRIESSTLLLLDRLGVEWRDREVYGNKRYNARSGWEQADVDLDGLPEPLRGELQAMCEEYGYDWPR